MQFDLFLIHRKSRVLAPVKEPTYVGVGDPGRKLDLNSKFKSRRLLPEERPCGGLVECLEGSTVLDDFPQRSGSRLDELNASRFVGDHRHHEKHMAEGLPDSTIWQGGTPPCQIGAV